MTMTRIKLFRLLMAAALAAALCVSAGAVFYPSEVRYPTEDGEPIYKTYDVEGMEQVEAIPRGDVSYHEQAYRFLELTVEPQRVSETKDYRETYSGTDALTDDPASIFAVLPAEKEVTTEDGFSGTVTLDRQSLVVEPDTFATASYTRRLTRTYPSMAEMDVAYLPPTITEGGVTYNLADCSWSVAAQPNPYDAERAESYTAVATYTRQTSSKTAKTWRFRADYAGTLKKDYIDGYRCVAIFEPYTPADAAKASGSGVGWKISTGLLGAALAAGVVYLFLKRDGKKPLSGGTTLMSLAFVLFLLSALGSTPAHALSYSVAGAVIPDVAQPTSVTDYAVPAADVAADYSKNAAYAPPAFGTAESYLPNRADKLINLRGTDGSGYGVVVGNGSIDPGTVNGAIRIVNGFPAVDDGPAAIARDTRTGYTMLTGEDYFSDGSIGRISIHAIGVDFGVYEGTDSAALNKGAGHYADTSIWDGNVCLAAHNRGVANNFWNLQTLRDGDRIELTTVYGTRVYSVYRVAKISDTDLSILTPTTQNIITLTTCVAGERAARYVVQGKLVEG